MPWNGSSLGLNRQDLAAFVIAAGGADPMRDIRSRALGTSAELRDGHDAIVSAAHALAASGRFSLWDTHIIVLLNLQFQFV
jgi:hypothetical protein